MGGSDGKIGRGWQKMVKACRKAVKNGSVADINEAESCLGCLDKLLRRYNVKKRLRLTTTRLSFLGLAGKFYPE